MTNHEKTRLTELTHALEKERQLNTVLRADLDGLRATLAVKNERPRDIPSDMIVRVVRTNLRLVDALKSRVVDDGPLAQKDVNCAAAFALVTGGLSSILAMLGAAGHDKP